MSKKSGKRPADVIGNAVRVMEIATGEAEDENPDEGKDPAAVELGRRGGKKGGKIRAQNLSPKERSASAKKAAKSRWGQSSEQPEAEDEQQDRSPKHRAKISSPDV